MDTEPEIRELYDSGSLKLTSAEKLVQVSPKGQKIAAKLVETTGTVTNEQIKELKAQYPQTRKELNQRKKGVSVKNEEITDDEIAQKVEELKKTTVIPELNKINELVNVLQGKKKEYDEQVLAEELTKIIEKLEKIKGVIH